MEEKRRKYFGKAFFLHVVFEVKDRTIFNGHKVIKKKKRSLVLCVMNSSTSRVEENEFAKILQRNQSK